MHRTLFLLPLLLAATAPTRLTPGLWEVASTPGTATLNGRPLDDLPYTPPTAPETICLTPEAAADPAAWLTRDVAAGCTLARRVLRNGKVDIAGTCPPQAPGLARGSVRLTGRYTADGYALRFATANPSENGTMGFGGAMTGRRVGPCPGQAASTAITASP